MQLIDALIPVAVRTSAGTITWASICVYTRVSNHREVKRVLALLGHVLFLCPSLPRRYGLSITLLIINVCLAFVFHDPL